MKKLILLLFASLVLVACGNIITMNENEERISDDFVEDDITDNENPIKEFEEEIERDPLPFNVEQVMNDFYELQEEIDRTDANVSYSYTHITLIGGLVDINIFFNALNNYLGDGEEINIIMNEIINEIIENQYLINEYNIEGVSINVNASDPSFIMISIMKE